MLPLMVSKQQSARRIQSSFLRRKAVRRDTAGFCAPPRPPPLSHALTAAHPVFAQYCASMRRPDLRARRARGWTHVEGVQLGEHG